MQDVVEDWRVVEIPTRSGFLVALVLDDGVALLASVNVEQVPRPIPEPREIRGW